MASCESLALWLTWYPSLKSQTCCCELLLMLLLSIRVRAFSFSRAGGCACSATIRMIRTLNLHSMCVFWTCHSQMGIEFSWLIGLVFQVVATLALCLLAFALFVLCVWDVAAPWTRNEIGESILYAFVNRGWAVLFKLCLFCISMIRNARIVLTPDSAMWDRH